VKSGKEITVYYSSRRFLFLWIFFTFSVLVFVFFIDYYHKKIEFNELNNEIARHISDKALIAESALEGFSAYVFSQHELNHQQASQVAQSILQRYPFLYMLEVAIKVDHKNRKQQEAELAKVYPGFSIKKFDYGVSRQWHDSPAAEIYYPIVFQEPYYTDEREVIGLDLFSSKVLIEAMETSLHENIPMASRPFVLVEDIPGYVIHRPLLTNAMKMTKPLTASMYTLLAIDSKKLFSDLLESNPANFSFTVSHGVFKSKDGGYPVILRSDPAELSYIETRLFPQFSMRQTISETVPSQPYIIETSWQPGWQDFNYRMPIFILFISAGIPLATKKIVEKQLDEKLKNMSVEGKLYYMANFDALTGLPNRYHFQEYLEHSIATANRSGERFGLFFIDIDKFKSINDTYGHAAGDITLKEVAKRLSGLLRKDELLARYGGDEFILVSNRPVRKDKIVRIIKRLKEQFIEPVEIENNVLDIDISIGYATYPHDAENIQSLLEIADRRMYSDKTEPKP
jgi:diguanylate cyclase (GGDEF)-like protein